MINCIVLGEDNPPPVNRQRADYLKKILKDLFIFICKADAF